MDDTGRSSGSFHSIDPVRVSRIDVISGPTGRRRWPDEVKGRLVAESYRTRLSVSAFARRNGVVPSQMFAWRRDAKAGKFTVPIEDGDDFFAPLVMEGGAVSASGVATAGTTHRARDGVIELEVRRVVIRLPVDTSPARIAEIVRALA